MYEQRKNEIGYIYYVNKLTGERQNDNPKLLEIMAFVRKQHESIKYITYRSATKIWWLKQSFYTVNIPYGFVTSVLSHYGLNQTDNAPVLKPIKLTDVLHDIYFAAEKCGHFSQSEDFNLDRCTAMLANLFWSIYDPNRMVPISLLEFKQLMLILCNTPHFDHLIMEEFAIAADHNRCVNRFRFESIIKVILKFFSYLDEHTNYGNHLIGEWVQECFKQCPGIIGLNEFQFSFLWQNQTIHFAHYSNVLALVYRIKESQNIVHEKRCVACKVLPIIGIRFKCQQCRNLSLCFECFCKGYKSSRHMISHRMYEISKNSVWKCCKPKRYSSVDDTKNDNLNMETKTTDEKNMTTGATTIECINETKFCSIRAAKELKDRSDSEISHQPNENQSKEQCINEIIDLMSHQVELIQKHLTASSSKSQKNKVKHIGKSKAFLNKHQIVLTSVIDKLHNLCASPKPNTTAKVPHSSTPYRNSADKRPRVRSIGSLSVTSIRGPIVNKSFLENNKSDLSLGDLSTWLHIKSTSQVANATAPTEFQLNEVDEFPVDPIDNELDTEMQNFKLLLSKIREIMDDSYSDNVELSMATRKLENVLDNIIGAEEQKRTYL